MGEPTNEPLYVARATIEKLGSLNRRARLATGEVLEFGLHGPVLAHYQLPAPERPAALPVDYIVAAAAG